MKYVVKSGDNLTKIGKSLGVSWQSIANANGIKPPYIIYPGQSLEVPTSGSSVTVQGPQPYNGQPIIPLNGSTSSTSTSGSGGSASLGDITNPLSMVVNGVVLYGIFRVLMKVL